MKFLAALALLAAASSCGVAAFACSDDDACVRGSTQGVCTPAGACAFPDAACASGLRYGDHSGAHSGECVPPDAGGSETGVAETGGSTSVAMSSTAAESTTAGVEASSGAADTSSTTDHGGSSTTQAGSTTGDTLDPDLLLWLRFEALGNDGVDNDGVLGGAAGCSGGCPTIDGGLARFDGTAACLAFPHQDELAPAAWTIAAWVRPAPMTGNYFLFGKAYEASSENSWELYVNESTGRRLLAVETVINNVVRTMPPPTGTWSHIAATYDGVVLRLWVGGTPQGEFAVPEVLYDDHAVRFGCDADEGVDMFHFDGWLADARFYGRALEGDELVALAVSVPPDP